MLRTRRYAAAGMMALGLGLSLGLATSASADSQRQITVTGDGVVTAVPDMAEIRLGVRHRNKQAEAAMEATAEAAARLVAQLKAAGIAGRDLQTAQLSLRQLDRHDGNGTRHIDGYEALTTLTVRVRDLATLGPILSSSLSHGANEFNGLSFTLSAPQAARDEARRAAMADALAKAALYAEAAGVELGQILSITEAGGRPTPMPMARMEIAMPVEAGEIGVNQQVTVVVELK